MTHPSTRFSRVVTRQALAETGLVLRRTGRPPPPMPGQSSSPSTHHLVSNVALATAALQQARDRDALECLDRRLPPVSDDGNEEHCAGCGVGGDIICCDGCTCSYHMHCEPSLRANGVPSDDFTCVLCVARVRAAAGLHLAEAAVRDATSMPARQASLSHRSVARILWAAVATLDEYGSRLAGPLLAAPSRKVAPLFYSTNTAKATAASIATYRAVSVAAQARPSTPAAPTAQPDAGVEVGVAEVGGVAPSQAEGAPVLPPPRADDLLSLGSVLDRAALGCYAAPAMASVGAPSPLLHAGLFRLHSDVTAVCAAFAAFVHPETRTGRLARLMYTAVDAAMQAAVADEAASRWVLAGGRARGLAAALAPVVDALVEISNAGRAVVDAAAAGGRRLFEAVGARGADFASASADEIEPATEEAPKPSKKAKTSADDSPAEDAAKLSKSSKAKAATGDLPAPDAAKSSKAKAATGDSPAEDAAKSSKPSKAKTTTGDSPAEDAAKLSKPSKAKANASGDSPANDAHDAAKSSKSAKAKAATGDSPAEDAAKSSKPSKASAGATDAPAVDNATKPLKPSKAKLSTTVTPAADDATKPLKPSKANPGDTDTQAADDASKPMKRQHVKSSADDASAADDDAQSNPTKRVKVKDGAELKVSSGDAHALANVPTGYGMTAAAAVAAAPAPPSAHMQDATLESPLSFAEDVSPARPATAAQMRKSTAAAIAAGDLGDEKKEKSATAAASSTERPVLFIPTNSLPPPVVVAEASGAPSTTATVAAAATAAAAAAAAATATSSSSSSRQHQLLSSLPDFIKSPFASSWQLTPAAVEPLGRFGPLEARLYPPAASARDMSAGERPTQLRVWLAARSIELFTPSAAIIRKTYGGTRSALAELLPLTQGNAVQRGSRVGGAGADGSGWNLAGGNPPGGGLDDFTDAARLAGAEELQASMLMGSDVIDFNMLATEGDSSASAKRQRTAANAIDAGGAVAPPDHATATAAVHGPRRRKGASLGGDQKQQNAAAVAGEIVSNAAAPHSMHDAAAALGVGHRTEAETAAEEHAAIKLKFAASLLRRGAIDPAATSSKAHGGRGADDAAATGAASAVSRKRPPAAPSAAVDEAEAAGDGAAEGGNSTRRRARIVASSTSSSRAVAEPVGGGAIASLQWTSSTPSDAVTAPMQPHPRRSGGAGGGSAVDAAIATAAPRRPAVTAAVDVNLNAYMAQARAELCAAAVVGAETTAAAAAAAAVPEAAAAAAGLPTQDTGPTSELRLTSEPNEFNWLLAALLRDSGHSADVARMVSARIGAAIGTFASTLQTPTQPQAAAAPGKDSVQRMGAALDDAIASLLFPGVPTALAGTHVVPAAGVAVVVPDAAGDSRAVPVSAAVAATAPTTLVGLRPRDLVEVAVYPAVVSAPVMLVDGVAVATPAGGADSGGNDEVDASAAQRSYPAGAVTAVPGFSTDPKPPATRRLLGALRPYMDDGRSANVVATFVGDPTR